MSGLGSHDTESIDVKSGLDGITCSADNFSSGQDIKIVPSGNVNRSLLNMLERNHFLIVRNYVLSVYSQRKYTFYHQNTLLAAFRTNSRNIIGRNPSMVILLVANQDLMPMLIQTFLGF